MTTGRAAVLLRHLHRLHAAEDLRRQSDQELLGRFRRHGDGAAFTALVERHGPMVLRVGRALLPDQADAEDVFQSAFLLLSRKAATLEGRACIAGWLSGTAYRLALKARTAAARRRRHEGLAPVKPPVDPLDELTLREAGVLLLEELHRLPESFRSPLVLCFWENATQDEAARRLGWSLSTLRRRLERGRHLLERRLTRRGLTLSAVLSAACLTGASAAAAVPGSLVRTAIHAALSLTAGAGEAGTGSAAILAKGASTSMFPGKLKIGLALLVGLALAGAGVGWARYAREAGAEPAVEAPVPQQQTRSAPPAEGPRVDALGDPLPEEAISRLGTTRMRHGGFIGFARFTPDGRCLVTQGTDGVRIWDAATGKQLHGILNDAKLMTLDSAALSPDGKCLATAGATGVDL